MMMHSTDSANTTARPDDEDENDENDDDYDDGDDCDDDDRDYGVGYDNVYNDQYNDDALHRLRQHHRPS